MNLIKHNTLEVSPVIIEQKKYKFHVLLLINESII
jgi:hypothetical protein